MKRNRLIALIILLLATSNLMAQTNLYVSPSGNDSWPGTEKKPFKTIEKAQAVVRSINENTTSDITVFLKGGTYPISKTLFFDQNDGGNDNHKVIFKALEGETPVLTGGTKVTNWQADKNGIYKASVASSGFRQLYANGKRGIRARQPNSGTYNRLTAWDLKGKNIILKSHQISQWQNFTDVEAVIQMFWETRYVHLKSFENFSGGTNLAYVSMADNESKVLFERAFPQKQDDAPFHFENAYEFIDQPNEWYFNSKTQELFFMPEAGVKMDQLEISIPATEKLLVVKGSLENPVKNLVFQGLHFEYSNWNAPSALGYLGKQSGIYFNTGKGNESERTPAAITISGASRIEFVQNVLQNLGGTAIDLSDATSECRIEGNRISQIGGTGVMVGPFDYDDNVPERKDVFNPTDKRKLSNNDVIRNNYIASTGRDYQGTCAIAAFCPAGLKIEHNTITDAPYSGISVGWGWTIKPDAMHDNLIAHNDISNVMNLLCDGAAIYTLSMQPGTQITRNYIHDMKKSVWAGSWPVAEIYLDEGTSGTEEKPVVVEKNLLSSWGDGLKKFHFHKEGIILLKYNTFYTDDEIIRNAGLEKPYSSFLKSKNN